MTHQILKPMKQVQCTDLWLHLEYLKTASHSLNSRSRLRLPQYLFLVTFLFQLLFLPLKFQPMQQLFVIGLHNFDMWQGNRRQDSNDCYNNHEFYQCETPM